MDTGSAVTLMSLHRAGSLVAAGGADRTVRVLDVAGMRRVRTLKGANTPLRALEFSSDGRWILGAATDGAVLVWDVPAARLLQTMRMSADSPVVGLSLSPTMDMLATVHEGRRGVYLWANSQMYTAPGGAAAAAVAEGEEGEEAGEAGGVKEMMVDLPRLHAEVSDGGEIVLGPEPAPEGEGEEEEIGAGTGGDAGKGTGNGAGGIDVSAGRPEVAEPVAPGMATMALLPRTQWLGLLVGFFIAKHSSSPKVLQMMSINQPPPPFEGDRP